MNWTSTYIQEYRTNLISIVEHRRKTLHHIVCFSWLLCIVSNHSMMIIKFFEKGLPFFKIYFLCILILVWNYFLIIRQFIFSHFLENSIYLSILRWDFSFRLWINHCICDLLFKILEFLNQELISSHLFRFVQGKILTKIIVIVRITEGFFWFLYYLI